MVKKLFHPFLLSLVLMGCNTQPSAQTPSGSSSQIVIHRFDKDLFQCMESKDEKLQQALEKEYPQMLEILDKSLFNSADSSISAVSLNLFKYYSEPTLKNLYADAIKEYDSVGDIVAALTTGFAYLHSQFPDMQIPAVYMHVSGLNQNVLVADSLLSLSSDKYMGIEYPLYKAFFNQPQRNKMQRELVAADYLAGWLMSEFPFTGNEQQLLDRMVYEGKIKQLVMEALPGIKMETLMGYTQQDADWWQKNEGVLWKYVIEHKQLNTADRITTARYFEDAHNNFPVIGAPANTGTWLGWQIVKAYQNKSNATPQQLMQVTDPNEILRVSEYKP